MQRHSTESVQPTAVPTTADMLRVWSADRCIQHSSASLYLTTNLQMKRDAMQNFWKHAGIEPSRTKPWKPKPDLLAFLQAL